MEIEETGRLMELELTPNQGERREGSREIDETTANENENANENDDGSNQIPPWKEHITIRVLVTGLIIGIMYSLIAMKLNLTTGVVPNLNASTAILAYGFIKGWKYLIRKIGFLNDDKEFTKQENTIIQTCAVACYGIAYAGGFGSYLLGLNKKTYEQAGVDTEGNSAGSYKEPGIIWMTVYLFLSSFAGLLALVPIRKIMIIDLKLLYPSGKATANLINGFHPSQEDATAGMQFVWFWPFFVVSLVWACIQWSVSGKFIYRGSSVGDGIAEAPSGSSLQPSRKCGFNYFPTFGLAAYEKTFYSDFSMTYIGAGMICPHTVNLSSLAGAVLSHLVMFPFIAKKKGKWFPSELPESSMKGLMGYEVFPSIALTLGDGFYNFIKVIINCIKPDENNYQQIDGNDPRADKVFSREKFSSWAVVGYVFLSIVSIISIPIMFPKVKWYFILLGYLVAPFLSFCNAYGAGLMDKNMAYSYGKVALFALAAMSGKQNGVVAGLVGCGLIKSMVSVSSDLMHDFKTGHITLTSPLQMLISQAIGTAIGCVVAPPIFFLFYKLFDIGNPNEEYKAPYAIIYRNMAILGVQGLSALPDYCFVISLGSFFFAIILNSVRDIVKDKVGEWSEWIPSPAAMAVPFLVGANFAIDMCIGSAVAIILLKICKKDISKSNENPMVITVASGLICGDGLSLLPSSILSMFRISPPFCMNLLPEKK